jgi:hypothetical protein
MISGMRIWRARALAILTGLILVAVSAAFALIQNP